MQTVLSTSDRMSINMPPAMWSDCSNEEKGSGAGSHQCAQPHLRAKLKSLLFPQAWSQRESIVQWNFLELYKEPEAHTLFKKHHILYWEKWFKCICLDFTVGFFLAISRIFNMLNFEGRHFNLTYLMLLFFKEFWCWICSFQK